MSRHAVVGAGYTGARIATALRSAGHDVAEYRRSAGGDARVVVLDLDRDDTPSLPGRFAALAYLVPPPSRRDDTRLARLFEACEEPPGRLVLASTSGVYGDHGGELVDESAEPAPKTERAIRRLDQERTARKLCESRGTRLIVLRIAGIYGPGRLGLDRIAAGEPVIASRELGPGNRIHVDDLAAVFVAAMTHPDATGIYNVSDGSGEDSTAFRCRTARLAGLPAPPEISRAAAAESFTPLRYSFHAESRRLDNHRLLTQLGVELRYSDPEAGIRASLPR